MMFKIDFRSLQKYKGVNFKPILFMVNNEYYETLSSNKKIENYWPILFKICFNKLYEINPTYFDNFGNKSSRCSELISINSHKLHDESSMNSLNAVKFSKSKYVRLFSNDYNNLVVIQNFMFDMKYFNISIFCMLDDKVKESNYKKEINEIKKTKFPNIKFKKGSLVVGHINSDILNEKEKLVNYIRSYFKDKVLLGDIELNESQEHILHDFMRDQLLLFLNNPSDYDFDYKRVFALGLVKYAAKYYNSHGTADFWPHLSTEYNISVNRGDLQGKIYDAFKNVMEANGFLTYGNGIQDITMHTFVADHCASKFFDFIFSFWKNDLSRNIENLYTDFYGKEIFDEFIDTIKTGNIQNVPTHTYLLFKNPRTEYSFKQRVRRILKLIDKVFFDDYKIPETGNRINHLLNIWINEKNSALSNDLRTYINRNKARGEIQFRTPQIKFESLKMILILPYQVIRSATKNSYIKWIVKVGDIKTEVEPRLYNDDVRFYIERCRIEYPLHCILEPVECCLTIDGLCIKSFVINSSSVRIFNNDSRYIDHTKNIVPQGILTIFSNNKDYPYTNNSSSVNKISENLYYQSKNFELGDILVFENKFGVQIGQNLTEGLNNVKPINGVLLLNNNEEYKIYNKLPNYIFKSLENEVNGICLIINGKKNRINKNQLVEFKIDNEQIENGYILKLEDYIINEGLFDVVLDYPNKQRNIGKIAFIKNFSYSFENAPYIFKREATIIINDTNIFSDNTQENEKIERYPSMVKYTFNFAENNDKHNEFCKIIEDRKLKLQYNINNSVCDLLFDVPAFYWKFKENEEWNINQMGDISLKKIDSEIKKLYVSGPFDFTNSKIVAPDDINISDEESVIKFDEHTNSFDISKAYNWFKNNRNTRIQHFYLIINEKNKIVFNVICKGKVNELNLFADFNKNKLFGNVNIEGDGDYSITITYEDSIICSDEQIKHNKFSIDYKATPGKYLIDIYELIEQDDDGFDFDRERILLNNNPIVKSIIDLSNIENSKIKLWGVQDLDKKYTPNKFKKVYFVDELIKTDYHSIIDDGNDIVGIWNEDIDPTNEEQMSCLTYYYGKLKTVLNGIENYEMDVLLIFVDINKIDSLIILQKNDDEYDSLIYGLDNGYLYSEKSYNKILKQFRKNFELIYDDLYKFILEIEVD